MVRLFDGACLCPQFLGIAQGCHGSHAARHEVGDQKLQGLLQRGILERVPGMFLKTLSTEMLGTAARSCMACYVCRHGHVLRAQMPACVCGTAGVEEFSQVHDADGFALAS